MSKEITTLVTNRMPLPTEYVGTQLETQGHTLTKGF
jgi:hypothetical protein